MLEKRWYPVLYMFIVTFVFSSVIIGFSFSTRSLVDANAKIAFEQAVLQVLPNQYEDGMTKQQIHQRFTERIAQPDAQSGGAYTLKENGGIKAYAVPIEGRGFWAPIKGLVGVAEDKKTITGIAFYEQNETPGLGAEIAKPEFRDQFAGKVMAVTDKPVKFRRPGEQLGESEVHAVTGATQTSVRLERIINDNLTQWREKVK
ncbi:MAG: FMN-binding protein [Phycisphaerae bacterium]|nr:FMN-binding protein [Phycisphaerae bacterium]